MCVNVIPDRSIDGINVQKHNLPEEKSNLPTLTVQFRDGKRNCDREAVLQKLIYLSGLKVLIYNESRRARILSAEVLFCKSDCFIGEGAYQLVTYLNSVTS